MCSIARKVANTACIICMLVAMLSACQAQAFAAIPHGLRTSPITTHQAGLVAAPSHRAKLSDVHGHNSMLGHHAHCNQPMCGAEHGKKQKTHGMRPAGLLFASAVALAAAGTRRRRRKAAPAPAQTETEDAEDKPLDIATEAAMGLSVTSEDRRRRKEKRRRQMIQQQREESDDAIENLISAGEDPEFFGVPFIFVQIGHLTLGVTAILSCFLSGMEIFEFALFDLEGLTLATLQYAVALVYVMNFFIGVYMFYEESTFGSKQLFAAFGWGVKGFLLGGVASWQRYHRIMKAQQRAEKERKKKALG